MSTYILKWGDIGKAGKDVFKQILYFIMLQDYGIIINYYKLFASVAGAETAQHLAVGGAAAKGVPAELLFYP